MIDTLITAVKEREDAVYSEYRSLLSDSSQNKSVDSERFCVLCQQLGKSPEDVEIDARLLTMFERIPEQRDKLRRLEQERQAAELRYQAKLDEVKRNTPPYDHKKVFGEVAADQYRTAQAPAIEAARNEIRAAEIKVQQASRGAHLDIDKWASLKKRLRLTRSSVPRETVNQAVQSDSTLLKTAVEKAKEASHGNWEYIFQHAKSGLLLEGG